MWHLFFRFTGVYKKSTSPRKPISSSLSTNLLHEHLLGKFRRSKVVVTLQDLLLSSQFFVEAVVAQPRWGRRVATTAPSAAAQTKGASFSPAATSSGGPPSGLSAGAVGIASVAEPATCSEAFPLVVALALDTSSAVVASWVASKCDSQSVLLPLASPPEQPGDGDLVRRSLVSSVSSSTPCTFNRLATLFCNSSRPSNLNSSPSK
mmetsp:Transcript_68191/g.134696  ORF Transcript_68191/g.134696 Transcript_68191/m.134696 type:complete len:206 (+) Transcript_68191:493-1110(+)